MMDAFIDKFSLRSKEVFLFGKYIDIIKRYGRAFGVTTIDEKDRIVIEHFWDSLMPLVFFDELFSSVKVIDVGSGAGFPGVPLKIVKNEIKLTLLESNHKKVAFLRMVVESLSLKDVDVLWKRMEKLSPEQKYDIILFRAVGSVFKLIPFLPSFLSERGKVFLYVGSSIENYMKRLESVLPSGLVIEGVKEYMLPGMKKKRHLIVMSAE